jgi:hypothetical protein
VLRCATQRASASPCDESGQAALRLAPDALTAMSRALNRQLFQIIEVGGISAS